jgi:hypothetical protein
MNLMLATIIAWIYITCICWIWGTIVILGFNKIDKTNSYCPHFSIICLIGLSFFQVVFGYFSLFIHVNSIYIHLGIIITSFFIFLIIKKHKKKGTVIFFPKMHPVIWILLVLCQFIILVMSTWHILHPDTLIYHAAIIQSIENNGIIIGYAQEKFHYGLNSSWFTVCGLFSFKFLGINALTFINTTIVSWFLIFVVDKIQQSYFSNIDLSSKDRLTAGILWLLILAISFLDYNQVRLTVTSGSPDFIAAIYTWSIFHIFNKEKLTKPVLLLLLTLSLVSITIKLSVFMLSLFIIYIIFCLFRIQIKYVVLAIIISIFVISPTILRNIFTSGYAFFPANFPDIFNVSWKLEDNLLHHMNNYIKAYARTKSGSDPRTVNQVINMHLIEWVPVWWNQKSIPQKVIIVLIPFFTVLNLLKLPSYISKEKKKELFTVTISTLGIVSWFILAPDPRFGLGFIIPCLSMPSNYIISSINYLPTKRIFIGIIACMCIILFIYLLHRLTHFFDLENILVPSGLK